jgi:hypothetical protein
MGDSEKTPLLETADKCVCAHCEDTVRKFISDPRRSNIYNIFRWLYLILVVSCLLTMITIGTGYVGYWVWHKMMTWMSMLNDEHMLHNRNQTSCIESFIYFPLGILPTPFVLMILFYVFYNVYARWASS